MSDALRPLFVSLGRDSFVLATVLGVAVAGIALWAVRDANSRRRAWVVGALVVGTFLIFGLAVQAQKQEPGIVILCENGGVYRSSDSGFLASGGPCVLHDRQGGHASADVIVVYDNTEGAP